MKKGTSMVPLIMGIIGGVLSVPSAICGGACAAGVGALAGDEKLASDAAGIFVGLGIAGGLLGLIGGIMGKPLPVPAGIVMLISVILVSIMAIPTINILGIIAAILILIGAALCFAQKKETPLSVSSV
ncbi:MAG: hypothetical protein Pg6A_05540 [Termitinemataceae bacterium]|nr:MAG: hypothetical protein Pg6A_05540 [Termitinemataceae bacterium]